MTMLVQAPTAIEQGELATLKNDQVEHYDKVPVQGSIVLDNTQLLFKSKYDPLHPNMPYLHIQGHVTQLSGNIPYTSGNVSFRDDDQHHAPKVDMFYNFDKNQLKMLVDKGLYDKGFAVPHELNKSALEMNDIPLNCNLSIIKPNDKTDVPIIFSQIENSGKIKIDLASTQYDLAGIFKTAQEQIVAEAKEKQKEAAETADKEKDKSKQKNVPAVADKMSNALSFDDLTQQAQATTPNEQVTEPETISSAELGESAGLDFSDIAPAQDDDLAEEADEPKEDQSTEQEVADEDLDKVERQKTQPTTPQDRAAHDLVAKAKARLEANRKKRRQVETMLNENDKDGDGIDDEEEDQTKFNADTDYDQDGLSDYEEDHDQEERPEENPNNGLFDTDDLANRALDDDDEEDDFDPESQATDPKFQNAIKQAEENQAQDNLANQVALGDSGSDADGDGLDDDAEADLDNSEKKKLVKKALARLAKKRHKAAPHKPAQPTHYQSVTTPETISKEAANKHSFHL